VKLLVLGAHSQLGTAFTRLLQGQGLPFEAIGTSELDLLKPAEVTRALGRGNPTQVVNLATWSNLEQAESDPAAARECELINTRGLATLAEVCSKLGLPLLHHSTSHVFDGQKLHPYTEEDETKPVSRYGLSKWYGERAIRDALSAHIILRTDWVFSKERPDFFRGHIEACKRNEGRLEVTKHRFSPTPAADVARVLLAVAHQLDCAAEVWGTYHYCALQPLGQEHFVEQFLTEAGKYDEVLAALLPKLQITKLPVQKPYIPNTVLSSQRLFETFGIKQRSRAAEVTAVLQALYGVSPPESPVAAMPEAGEGEPLPPPRKPRVRARSKAGIRKSGGSARPAKKGAVRKTSPQS